MKERPMLFSAPMVLALQARTKTQTRRILKIDGSSPSGAFWDHGGYEPVEIRYGEWAFRSKDAKSLMTAAPRSPIFKCPYGTKGSKLWVKETWATSHRWDGIKPSELPIGGDGVGCAIYYRECDDTPQNTSRDGGIIQRWRPSIFMPRWASRITLEIEQVRVERLNDISEEDALAEGIGSWEQGYPRSTGEPFVGHEQGFNFGRDLATWWVPTSSPTAVLSYKRLWESINGPGSWEKRPWVWAVTFRRLLNESEINESMESAPAGPDRRAR